MADNEQTLVISRLAIEGKKRTVISRDVVAAVPAKSGEYETLTGEQIKVDVRLGVSRRAERAVDVDFGNGDKTTVSISRKTGSGIMVERIGRTAIEVAITDPSLLRAAPKPQLGQNPRMS